jgi:hypothetical protein
MGIRSLAGHTYPKITAILGAAALALMLFATISHAAPKADLWPRWEAHDPQSSATVDHALWGDLLSKYLVADHPSGVNLLDYAGVAIEDRVNLSRYLAALEGTKVTALNRDEQKAYWINLYNAQTVKTILDNYPVDSIKDIRSGWFSPGPWELELLEIEGEELTLNDIEHRILRPIWRDPRIHFAVNCASIGCPDLAAEPYTAANSERLLDQSAHAFINHPRGVSLENGELKLSSIFHWFATDFGKNEREVIGSLIPFAKPELAEQLEHFNGSVDYDYDWTLNQK